MPGDIINDAIKEILQDVTDGIVVISGEEITFANAAAEKLAGKELTGKAPRAFYSEFMTPAIREAEDGMNLECFLNDTPVRIKIKKRGGDKIFYIKEDTGYGRISGRPSGCSLLCAEMRSAVSVLMVSAERADGGAGDSGLFKKSCMRLVRGIDTVAMLMLSEEESRAEEEYCDIVSLFTKDFKKMESILRRFSVGYSIEAGESIRTKVHKSSLKKLVYITITSVVSRIRGGGAVKLVFKRDGKSRAVELSVIGRSNSPFGPEEEGASHEDIAVENAVRILQASVTERAVETGVSKTFALPIRDSSVDILSSAILEMNELSQPEVEFSHLLPAEYYNETEGYERVSHD